MALVTAGIAIGLFLATRRAPTGARSQVRPRPPARVGVTTLPAPSPTAAIAASYDAAFDLTDKTLGAKEVVIEDGESLREALASVESSSLTASVTGTAIQSVTFLTDTACRAAHVSAPCAAVDYALLGPNGQVLGPTTTGFAVEDDGFWLVAKATACGVFNLVVQAEGVASSAPGCPP